MPSVSPAPDYKVDRRPPVFRPADLPAVEEFLQLLARAVRQFHTYPATSPLCTDAIAACQHALAALDNRERVACLVTPHELIVDDIGIGTATIVEHELVRRLQQVHVAAIDVERTASPRDLSKFCDALAHCAELVKTKTTLVEALAEQGVATIVPRLAHRPEVLAVGVPRAPLRHLVEHERDRRMTAMAEGGPVSYLYPPDKGWVRLDPAAPFDTVSLVDLAILVDDPREVATMLLRLTDDEPGVESRDAALQQKFGDVATLFSALDPRLARIMFSKLARAVLDLAPERRKDLLKRTILPGLLDGRAAGTVLRDFPDVDLTESLSLLLDLETAAPEVLTTALDRLDLPSDRRETLAPMLEARLRGGDVAARSTEGAGVPGGNEATLDRHARRLMKVDLAAGKNFAEFAAFDLSIDDHTAVALDEIRSSIGITDVPVAHLRLLLDLVRLEANPTTVEAFLHRSANAFAELHRSARLSELAAAAAGYRQLAESLQASRPEIADAIAGALGRFWTPARATTLAELYESDATGRALANSIVDAFGAPMAPALVALLDNPASHTGVRSLVPLMCDHGRLFAPALVAGLERAGTAARRAIVRVLGFAGPGHEQVLGTQLDHEDEQTSREAFRALARIGTGGAAALVSVRLREGNAAVRAAAEEALRHFPPAQANAALRDVLGHRDFVLHHPQVAMRLLDRVAHAKSPALEPAMRALASMRFRFWNPALVRVALKARTLLQQ